MRLGCLNHALLTVEVIASRGLVLAGWVANVVDADMASIEENVAVLQQRIGAPLLGIVPHLPHPEARTAAGHLDLDRLYNTGDPRD
jgi:dethiobiotin synthetase